jgi:protein SCO1
MAHSGLRIEWPSVVVCWAILCCALSCAPVPATGEVSGATPVASPSSSLFREPWRWTDEHGELVRFSKWRGSPLVVSMFFRSCTERCPLTVEKLRRIEAAFAKKNRTAQFVLVTLDPKSDTPSRLLAFKEGEHLSEGSFHLLNGGDAETRALGRLLGVHPSAIDEAHIDHEVRIAVFDAKGILMRSFAGWGFDDADAVIQ